MKETHKPISQTEKNRPLPVIIVSFLLIVAALALLVSSILYIKPETGSEITLDSKIYQNILIAGTVTGIIYVVTLIIPFNLFRNKSGVFYLALSLFTLDFIYSLIYILTYREIIIQTGVASFWIFLASIPYCILSIIALIRFRQKHILSPIPDEPAASWTKINAMISLLFPFWIIGFIARAINNVRPGTFGFDYPVDIFRQTLWLGIMIGVISLFFLFLAMNVYRLKNWARTVTLLLLVLGFMYYAVLIIFNISANIFAGEQVKGLLEISRIIFQAILQTTTMCLVPGIATFILIKYSYFFDEPPEQRKFLDRTIRYLLLATALSAIFIVFLIIFFTITEAWQSIQKIGIPNMFHIEYNNEKEKWISEWRPGEDKYALIPMIIGSIFSTLGAALIGIPLSVGAAVLLAEVAPSYVREFIHPAIELLAGIPSVIYGLFGMVVVAPLIRQIDVPRNTGFGLLTASIILAVMIIPTITNIAEDAIRAVPKSYKEGSLALGCTHWQTISQVIIPAARSGIIAAIILGIGRALGETMAVIMIIGNSIAIPAPLTNNPLTLALSQARTLTGNIAVEIMYASGEHRSALFFTGVLLFFMIIIVNSTARFIMKERVSS